MRFILALSLLSACATTKPPFPITLYANTSMSTESLENTYRLAQDIFVENTKCTPPRDKTLAVIDQSVEQINTERGMILTPNEIPIAIGEYNADTRVIKVALESPDQELILFHEYLHFMLMESKGCPFGVDANVQHAIIRQLTNIYLKRTHKREPSDEWLKIVCCEWFKRVAYDAVNHEVCGW